MFACSPDRPVTQPNLVELSAIAVDATAQILERGTRDTLTATALDEEGDTVVVPVVWQSSNERVAIFQRGGVLIALDTGTTQIRASSLGLQSDPIVIGVIWLGPAAIDSGTFSPPNARGPGVALTDSVRVIVTNSAGNPVPNAIVAFTVTEGGGSVSAATDSTSQNGIASTRWTLGPVPGRNTVTAAVVKVDGSPDTLVAENLVTFVINSYDAVTVQAGDNQTGLLLSELPTQPSVKLVDSLGAARQGVPVTFTVFQNGRVALPIVSTGADGIASPGKWTLGEFPGAQTLEARVEDAKVALQATATGTPVFYMPDSVTAGGFTTCGLHSGGIVKCWGAEFQIGTGDTTDIPTPTPVQGTLVAASVKSGSTHNCALTSVGAAWCWGEFAFTDTAAASSPHAVVEPRPLQSNISWAQISPGAGHNCGLDLLENAFCWGLNAGSNAGQLGDGSTTTRRVPTPVAGGFKFSRVSAGSAHTCGLTNGAAFCWGQNSGGQLGDGTAQPRTSPTAATGGHTYEWIGAGADFSCALTPQPEGKAYCWGLIFGTPQLNPTTYPTAPPFVSMSVGGGHACALTADAAAYCWGANGFGQVGDSTFTFRNSPTRVVTDLRFTRISAGFTHTCGMTTGGAVACWGRNRSGELGDTTAAFRRTPRHVILGVTP